MKTEHVILWANSLIKDYGAMREPDAVRYAARKYAYEVSYINKLFGFKYEKSNEHHEYTYWYKSILDNCVEELADIIREAEYNAKIGVDLMTIHDKVWARDFYVFCENNYLPY